MDPVALADPVVLEGQLNPADPVGQLNLVVLEDQLNPVDLVDPEVHQKDLLVLLNPYCLEDLEVPVAQVTPAILYLSIHE